MRVISRGLLLSLMVGAAAPASVPSGYFLVGGVGLSNRTIEPGISEIIKTSENVADLKEKKKSCELYLGALQRYVLARRFSLSGTVYMTYNCSPLPYENVSSYKLPYDNHDIDATFSSALKFNNRFGAGFEAQIGIPVSIGEIYMSGGVKIDFPKLRGDMSLSGNLGTGKDKVEGHATVYFGKDAAQINTFSFPKQTQKRNWLLSPTVGGGVRFFLLDRVFVGVDAKYFIPRTKAIKARYSAAAKDPVGALRTMLSTNGINSDETPVCDQSNFEMVTKFKQWSVMAQFGVRF